MNAWLQCIACAERFEIGPMFYGCPACKAKGKMAPLEVTYALREIRENDVCDSAPGLWRWAPLLPSIGEESRVSLGEGRTPLLPIASGREGPQRAAQERDGESHLVVEGPSELRVCLHGRCIWICRDHGHQHWKSRMRSCSLFRGSRQELRHFLPPGRAALAARANDVVWRQGDSRR